MKIGLFNTIQMQKEKPVAKKIAKLSKHINRNKKIGRHHASFDKKKQKLIEELEELRNGKQ